MKLNWQDEDSRKNLIAWIIAESLPDSVVKADGFDPTNLDVKLTINGVEVDLKETFTFLESQLEKQVTDVAKELIQEKFGNVTRSMDTMIDAIERIADDRRTDAFEHMAD